MRVAALALLFTLIACDQGIAVFSDPDALADSQPAEVDTNEVDTPEVDTATDIQPEVDTAPDVPPDVDTAPDVPPDTSGPDVPDVQPDSDTGPAPREGGPSD